MDRVPDLLGGLRSLISVSRESSLRVEVVLNYQTCRGPCASRLGVMYDHTARHGGIMGICSLFPIAYRGYPQPRTRDIFSAATGAIPDSEAPSA